MQTNTATSDRKKRVERARAIARAKARRAARSKAASNTKTEVEQPDREQARAKALAKARAAAAKEEKVASDETAQTAEPDYAELREKLRAQARQRFAARIAQIRQSETNEQLRNEPATEDVESKGGSSTNEQERNEPDTEDVESENFNDSGARNDADRPSDINDGDQGNSAVTQEDSSTIASQDRGDLIQIFTYVEDLEQRGILNRADRYANIARFEQMGSEKFAGYKAAMEDAKQHIEAAKAPAAPRPRKASRNDEERPVARVPQMGRHTVEAAAGGDGDYMDDSLAFLP